MFDVRAAVDRGRDKTLGHYQSQQSKRFPHIFPQKLPVCFHTDECLIFTVRANLTMGPFRTGYVWFSKLKDCTAVVL